MKMSAAEFIARATQPTPRGTHIDLTSADVEGAVSLSRARVGNLDLTGTTFHDAVTCEATQFDGIAWFRRCRFLRGVSCIDARFSNDARFDDMACDDHARFDAAEFLGIAMFDRARVKGRLSLDRVISLGNTSLADVRLSGGVSARGAHFHGGLWLDGARFDQAPDVRGADIHGRFWLKRIGMTGLSERQAQETLLQQATIYGYAFR